jgi:FkbM family methyltransferase
MSARATVLRLLTRTPYGVRLRLLRGPAPIAGSVRATWRWAGREPLPVGGGEAKGLLLDAGFDPGHVQMGELADGTIEPEVQRLLVDRLGAGDVLYDVGANLGFFSLLGARRVGPRGAVHAFEPVAENAASLRRSAARNRFDSITVHELAVAAESGSGPLLMLADASWARLDGGQPRPEATAERTVEVVALDHLVEHGRAPPPTLVKIDVEGGEAAVLEGMAGILDRCRPTLLLELHGSHAAPVPGLLDDAGYALEPLAGASLERLWPPIHALGTPRV